MKLNEYKRNSYKVEIERAIRSTPTNNFQLGNQLSLTSAHGNLELGYNQWKQHEKLLANTISKKHTDKDSEIGILIKWEDNGYEEYYFQEEINKFGWKLIEETPYDWKIDINRKLEKLAYLCHSSTNEETYERIEEIVQFIEKLINKSK